ncbi:MAG: S-adenosylmethionine:tRNA ribosyltransferase-isomerase [Bdellovibrionota bacterium]
MSLQTATRPRDRHEQKLLVIRRRPRVPENATFSDLPHFLNQGDLLIFNDAATYPASLKARTQGGQSIEVRLVAKNEDGSWQALVLGEGDWRIRTEDRPAPPRLGPKDVLFFGNHQSSDEKQSGTIVPDFALPDARRFTASIEAVSKFSNRFMTLRFEVSEQEMWKKIFELGQPIQYSYLKEELSLWSVQTLYSSLPWASEMPSAGRPFTAELLIKLARKGIEFATLTHATGISSTGDEALDEKLPLNERFFIPAKTIEAIGKAKNEGKRVVAVGTSVVRALEGCYANHGALHEGMGSTGIILSATTKLCVVSGVISGIHDQSESHFRLLEAFAPREALIQAAQFAQKYGYLQHEFGDSCLVLRS